METSKSRICLTTYFDENFSEVGNLCLKSIEKYARAHNYEVELLNHIKSDRPASWNKILVIQELFNKGYDFVFWIDADAILVRFDQDIKLEIEEDKDIYLVSIQFPKGEAPGLGVLLIKNSLWSRKILNDLWSMVDYKSHVGWENGAFVDYFGLINFIGQEDKKRFYKNVQFNNPKFDLLKKVKWLDQSWHHWHWFFKKNKKPIINHYSIAPYFLRLLLMSKDAYSSSLITKKELLINLLKVLKKILWKT